MKVLFASYSACIRCVKEGLAIGHNGNDVIFLQNRVTNPFLQNTLPILSFYNGSREQFRAKLEMFPDIDLIHVHNEPSWLGWIAKEVRPDIPMVFDAHDLNAVRSGRPDEDEIKSMAVADAVILPSRGYRDYCLNEFRHIFQSLNEKTVEVVYSFCNNFFFDIMKKMPKIPGIVYEGAVAPTVDYRDYRGIAEEISGMDIPFYLYGSNMAYVRDYAPTGAICMPTLPYFDLINNLSRYDWGLCASPVKSPQWDRAMPNKLFEYLNAGIPILVYQADEVAEFVQEHDLGVVIDEIAEIPGIYDRHKDYRQSVEEKRRQFTMESQLEKIHGVYEDAIASAKRA